MTDLSKRQSSQADAIEMRDPQDREVHEPWSRTPYPSSPKGTRELYTDGGDVEDEAAGVPTSDEGGAFEGAHDKDLKKMSEAEYQAWKKGRTQDS